MMRLELQPPNDVGAPRGSEAELDAISARVAEAYPPRVTFAPRAVPAMPLIDSEVDELRVAIAAALSPKRANEVNLADVVFRLGKIEDALAGLRANQGRLVERIITFVCFATSIHPRDLLSERRKKHFAYARFAVMWGAKRFTNYSLPRIAERLGGLDHTTVIHGLRRADELREKDRDFRILTDALHAHFSAVTAPPQEEDAPCLPLPS